MMAAEKKAVVPTRYTILKQYGSDGGWQLVNEGVLHTSADQAIRAAVVMLPSEQQGGVYVAVPARSWHPQKVAPKTTVQLELTEVKA